MERGLARAGRPRKGRPLAAGATPGMGEGRRTAVADEKTRLIHRCERANYRIYIKAKDKGKNQSV